MGSTVESIVDSYEARVGTVGALIRQTVDVLKRFDREQEEKLVELRVLLGSKVEPTQFSLAWECLWDLLIP